MKTPELSTDKTECRSICLLGGDCESLIWFIILGLPRRQAHASDKILAATSAAATLQKQQLINNRIHFIYRTNANRLTSKKTKKKREKQKTKTVSACIYKASDVDTGLGSRLDSDWDWNLLGRCFGFGSLDWTKCTPRYMCVGISSLLLRLALFFQIPVALSWAR